MLAVISVTKARKNWKELINNVRYRDRSFFITKNAVPVALIKPLPAGKRRSSRRERKEWQETLANLNWDE